MILLGQYGAIRENVRTRNRRVASKTPEPSERAHLVSIKTFAPLILVCQWMLVITDHFTKLAHAFPCRDQTAKTVAKKLWDSFFCVYRLDSDQGISFESELLADLLELAGADQSSNGQFWDKKIQLYIGEHVKVVASQS